MKPLSLMDVLDLSTICVNCGQPEGKHSAHGNLCPSGDWYSETQTFRAELSSVTGIDVANCAAGSKKPDNSLVGDKGVGGASFSADDPKAEAVIERQVGMAYKPCPGDSCERGDATSVSDEMAWNRRNANSQSLPVHPRSGDTGAGVYTSEHPASEFYVHFDSSTDHFAEFVGARLADAAFIRSAQFWGKVAAKCADVSLAEGYRLEELDAERESLGVR